MKSLCIPLVIVLAVVAAPAFNANGQTVTLLYSFGSNPNDGSSPYAGLVQGSDSNFYGTTVYGGTYGDGTVFRVNPSGTETTLYSFAGNPDGSNPKAGLVQGSDGNFYGTTVGGGTDDGGTMFQISPSGSYTSLYSFGSDGVEPNGLVQGSDSNFYGTTAEGGTYGDGTVFQITPDGDETLLYSFAGPPNDGETPEGGLVQGGDGNFYGTTAGGGMNGQGFDQGNAFGYGTVFRVSPSGVETTLYSFAGPPDDGLVPTAGLVQGSDSNFYGTVMFSNTKFYGGAVFRISPGGTEKILHFFPLSPKDGNAPAAGLVQGSDGNFYGTTSAGGAYNYTTAGVVAGTVFRISPLGSEKLLHSFSGPPNDGNYPQAGLVQGSDGNFYGTTSGGGMNTDCYLDSSLAGCGTVFKLAVAVSGGGGGDTNCTYTLSATSVTLAAKGGPESVSVKVTGTDCPSWTAAGNDPFISITSGSSGTGNGVVHYTVAPNTNTELLVGTMTIADQTFTVTQDIGGCTYSLGPKDAKLKDTGGSATVKVTPNYTDCDWLAASNDGFIMITAGDSGTGKGTVSYTVAANTNTEALVGTMTIASEIFTVDVAAATCEFSLGETAASFSSAGGSSNVTVTANGTNCTWKTTVAGSFIHITAGDSGTGSGAIDYTVSPNTKTATQKGTITVGKEKLTITESAAP